MRKEEKDCEEASAALTKLIARDMALETEAWTAHEAGDYAKADAARVQLVPAILKAEENVYRVDIAANTIVKDEIADYIRRDAGNSSPQDVEAFVKSATATFDNEIWKLGQQLADNLRKQSEILTAHNE